MKMNKLSFIKEFSNFAWSETTPICRHIDTFTQQKCDKNILTYLIFCSTHNLNQETQQFSMFRGIFQIRLRQPKFYIGYQILIFKANSKSIEKSSSGIGYHETKFSNSQ